jgi:hypothetical protein
MLQQTLQHFRSIHAAEIGRFLRRRRDSKLNTSYFKGFQSVPRGLPIF